MGDSAVLDLVFAVDGGFDLDFGVLTEVVVDESGFPLYEGDADVVPSVYGDVVLATAGRRLEDDVVVRKIPQYEVANGAGGVTLIIGGD